MKLKVSKALPKGPTTTLVPLVQDEALERTLYQLAETWGIPGKVLTADFQAKAGQHHLVYDRAYGRHHLIGLGAEARLPQVATITKNWIFRHRDQLPAHPVVQLWPGAAKDDPALIRERLEGLVQGALQGRYDIGLYKTASGETPPFRSAKASLSFWGAGVDAKLLRPALRKAEAIGQAQLEILDLVNGPGNKVIPQTLADWAKASGKAYGYKVTVFNKSQCLKKGLHALLAVNRGSEYDPAFIIMEYRPAKAGRKKLPVVGLAGKGVTFDTGGLSIKGATNMHYMKSDMGGAAAVLGTLEACARLQLPVHLYAIVPTTDNCVDANSVKPGDVIDSYSGKSIEIIDTDAEGRLILADALCYLHRNFQPEILIDLATLTGSTVRTLGYHAGGLFTANDQLAQLLSEAGQEVGERLWRLPLWQEYFADMESDVADIRNFSGKPLAGAITAAKFLEFFTEEHPAWAHLDIAGVAFGQSGLSSQKSATGYGIRLLIQFLEKWLRQKRR
ncbi:MAG: leucyl aminopeptidase family protein [Bacteroidota bacterium]